MRILYFVVHEFAECRAKCLFNMEQWHLPAQMHTVGNAAFNSSVMRYIEPDKHFLTSTAHYGLLGRLFEWAYGYRRASWMTWSYLARCVMRRLSLKAAVKGFKNSREPRQLPMQLFRCTPQLLSARPVFFKYCSSSKLHTQCTSLASRPSNNVSSMLYWCGTHHH